VKNILLTSAGRRVSLLRCFQRDLKELNIHAEVFSTDLRPDRSSACQVASACFASPRVTDPSYAGFLLDLCKTHNVGMVVPTIDTELLVLSECRLEFLEHGIQIVVSDGSLISTCRDKRKTHKLFESLGLHSAEIFTPDNPQYPCFAKPIGGSCSVGLHLVEHPNDWPSNVQFNPDYMLCEYLQPDEHLEYTVDMYFNMAGKLSCLIPRQRLETRAGEVSKGRTVNGDLVKRLWPIFDSLQGARGCLTLQVFINHESSLITGIEINPRFGGGFPLSDYAGGKYTEWLIRELFLNENIPEFHDWADQQVMLRFDDAIFFDENCSAS